MTTSAACVAAACVAANLLLSKQWSVVRSRQGVGALAAHLHWLMTWLTIGVTAWAAARTFSDSC